MLNRYDKEPAEKVFQSFKALTKKDQTMFFGRLLEDKKLREDLIDIAISTERLKEPGRPLDDVLKEIEAPPRKRALSR